ncbi:MAG: FtsQ-type POTRA domain-containing protein [Candidatus Binatia bacterium]
MKRLFAPRNRRRRAHAAELLRAAAPIARRVLPVVVALVLVTLTGPAVSERMRRHPYFGVREIAVRSHGHLDAAQVRARAAIEPGSSIWDLDPPAVEARLRADPWIRTAQVRRELPSRVVVQVRQYRPAAIVHVADPKPALYYVAASGRVFATVGPGETYDLPYITGLTVSDLEGGTAIGPHGVRRALHLLRLVGRGVPGLHDVSEVHVEAANGLTLLPVRPRVPIRIGWGRFDEKLAHVGRVLALWAGREGEMLQVNSQFEDQVIVRTRAPAVPAGPAGAKRPART